MRLDEHSRLRAATNYTEQGVLAALAESEALPKLFETRNGSRDGDGACHISIVVDVRQSLPELTLPSRM